MIVVTLQHPNPYFDDSYAVNSVNVGPYGDAILQELIPEIEKRFRMIRQPWARLLSGGSTGGWEALALQIFYPDFFGGTWSYCPDSVDFSDVEGINVYKDKNAFYKEIDWRREPTINSREINGQVRQTSEQRNHFELVNGTHGRSGEQTRYLVGGIRSARRGRLFRAAVRQAHRRDEPRSGAVLEGALRSALSPGEELVHARPEAGGPDPCFCGRCR